MADVKATGVRCANCDHPADWHRFDDAQPWGVTDARAKFRCIGYDCEVGGPPVKNSCTCPDFSDTPEPGGRFGDGDYL